MLHQSIGTDSNENKSSDGEMKEFVFDPNLEENELDELFDDTLTLDERISRNRTFTRSQRTKFFRG